MRLIDADALKMYMRNALEETRNCYPDGGEWSATITEEFCKDIDEQPTIEERKWIPCSERLPEEKINPNTLDYEWVLCSTTFGDVRAYRFGSERFWHGCGDMTQHVIAWMPLPEPYREDEYEV